MKRSDQVFLTHLRQNARATLTSISKKTKIPISTLYDKLRMHEGNLILKHTTLLDFSKLGYNCRANILLRTSRETRDKLCSYLKAHTSINNLFKINNGYDYMAEGIFENVKHMEDFMEELERAFKLEDKKAHYIIDDLKREDFLLGNV
ncbi:Lrp/AsnC family transcriptional regulator [Candidatus Woesearchaeota archaeon]|nr:Lrp/AsnC family transcriptional regulator [Candidatus Woesearchaeota archaeon]